MLLCGCNQGTWLWLSAITGLMIIVIAGSKFIQGQAISQILIDAFHDFF
jgi:hypothetical protein